MLSPEIVQEITENKIELSKAQMIRIYETIQLIPKYNLTILSQILYDFIIENANKKLKNHILGRTIFHLKNHNRLNTYIGLEKLFYAGMIIDSAITFDLLTIDKETHKIADQIRYIIETVE